MKKLKKRLWKEIAIIEKLWLCKKKGTKDEVFYEGCIYGLKKIIDMIEEE